MGKALTLIVLHMARSVLFNFQYPGKGLCFLLKACCPDEETQMSSSSPTFSPPSHEHASNPIWPVDAG